MLRRLAHPPYSAHGSRIGRRLSILTIALAFVVGAMIGGFAPSGRLYAEPAFLPGEEVQGLSCDAPGHEPDGAPDTDPGHDSEQGLGLGHCDSPGPSTEGEDEPAAEGGDGEASEEPPLVDEGAENLPPAPLAVASGSSESASSPLNTPAGLPGVEAGPVPLAAAVDAPAVEAEPEDPVTTSDPAQTGNGEGPAADPSADLGSPQEPQGVDAPDPAIDGPDPTTDSPAPPPTAFPNSGSGGLASVGTSNGLATAVALAAAGLTVALALTMRRRIVGR